MYFVYVGNIGLVCETEDRWDAIAEFVEYVRISKQPYGRASNEEVVLWDNEDILEHYVPTTNNEDN